MKGKIKEILSRMAYLHIEYEKAWKSMKQFGLGGMGEEKCEKVRKEGQMKEKSEKVLKREEKGGRRGESSHQGGSINSNGGNIPTIFTMELVIVLNNISAPPFDLCLLLSCFFCLSDVFGSNCRHSCPDYTQLKKLAK